MRQETSRPHRDADVRRRTAGPRVVEHRQPRVHTLRRASPVDEGMGVPAMAEIRTRQRYDLGVSGYGSIDSVALGSWLWL